MIGTPDDAELGDSLGSTIAVRKWTEDAGYPFRFPRFEEEEERERWVCSNKYY